MNFIKEIKQIKKMSYDEFEQNRERYIKLCNYIKETFNIDNDIISNIDIDSFYISYTNKNWHLEIFENQYEQELWYNLYINNCLHDAVQLVGENEYYSVFSEYNLMERELYNNLIFLKDNKRQKVEYRTIKTDYIEEEEDCVTCDYSEFDSDSELMCTLHGSVQDDRKPCEDHTKI